MHLTNSTLSSSGRAFQKLITTDVSINLQAYKKQQIHTFEALHRLDCSPLLGRCDSFLQHIGAVLHLLNLQSLIQHCSETVQDQERQCGNLKNLKSVTYLCS